MATIGDVAREAGVARSTVSAVLNGRKLVLPDTRARVEAAIERLNYSVNSGARALATRRTMNLGLVVRFHDAEFSPALASYIVAITDAAREHGYGVLLLTETDGAAAIRKTLAAGQVDGLLLLSVVEDDPRIDPIVEAGFPAVLIGMPHETRGIDAVDLDFADGARQLVAHLAQAGHRRATFVTWPEDFYTSGRTYAKRFRESALLEAERLGVRLELEECPAEPEEARAALRESLLREGAPEALLVHNDTAIALLPMALNDVHLRVPQDRSVVSLYSSDLSRLYSLPFTAVESEPEHISALAVETLVRRLTGGGDGPGTETLVSPSLIERASVAVSHE